MGIDGGEEGSANTMMRVLLVGDVGTVTITEFLCEAKIDDVNEMGPMTGAHNKVGWLDIAMNKVVRVNELDAG
jgi:adenylosuccinate synthase